MSEVGEKPVTKIAGRQRTTPPPKRRLGQAFGAVVGFFKGEAEPNPESPQLWDVLETLRERSGLNTDQRGILTQASNLFLGQFRKKSNGLEWDLKNTPAQLQNTEYSLLTLFCLERFLPDIENDLIQELNNPGPRSAWNIAEQKPGNIRQLTDGVKIAIRTKEKWLWEQFCQRNSVESENPSAQEHRQLVQQKAKVLSSLLHRSEDNSNEVHRAIGDAFEGIEAGRLSILPSPLQSPL